METAIVTGANGFMGQYFVRELIQQGYQVIAVIRNKSIENISSLPRVQVVYCDMCEMEKLKERIGNSIPGSIFFHLAWSGNSGEARGDYSLQLDNVRFAVKAAEVAVELGCRRFVGIGSVTQLMYRDYLYRDNIHPEMITCYAIGKMTAEAMLKCVCNEKKLELNWAYVANFYGCNDPTHNFINFLIDSYSKGVVPELTSAEQLADFTYVTDVAKALCILGEQGKPNNSYYIGYGEPKPLKRFIEIIHQTIAPQIESGIGRKIFSGMNIDFDAIDYKKFTRDTGFKPEIPFEIGIEKVIMARGREVSK